jgi:hypothetical protein
MPTSPFEMSVAIIDHQSRRNENSNETPSFKKVKPNGIGLFLSKA